MPAVAAPRHKLPVSRQLAALRTVHLARLVQRHGRVAEYSGFQFQADIEPGDPGFDGVEMFDPIDTIHVSETAFDRSMSRYFTTIIDAVTRRQRPELHEPWWPSFVDAARIVRERSGLT